jgi:hypothetical protein
MAGSQYPCVQCGRPTEGDDRYVVCEACLDEFERSLGDGPRSVREAPGAAAHDGAASPPLSPGP